MTPGRSAPVVFLHPSDELYGSDRQLLEIVRLATSRRRCVVVLPDDVPRDGPLSAELRDLGVPVCVGPMPVLRRSYLRASRLVPWALRATVGLWWLARLLRSERPALIVTNTTALPAGPTLAALLRCRHIWWVRELVESPGWYRRFVRALGRLPAGEVHAISDAVAAWLGPMGRHGPSVLRDAVPVAGERHQLGSEPRALFVGRINEWKGWDVFVEAAREVHATLPAARFAIAGGTVPGDQAARAQIERSLRMADPEQRWLTWLGEVEDARSVMRDAWVVVAPSRRPEPLGNVVLEAMAEGRAAIGTRMGGIPELILDGTTGLLVPGDDAAALAAAMLRLLGDRGAADVMGLAGRARFHESFSPGAFEAAWLERLDAALAPGT